MTHFYKKLKCNIEKGSMSLVMMAFSISMAVGLVWIPSLYKKTQRFVKFTKTSQRKDLGYSMNISSINYLVQLLEDQQIFLCQHNVLSGEHASCTDGTFAADQKCCEVPTTNPDHNRKLFLEDDETGVPGVNWRFADYNEIGAAAPHGVFALCSIDPRYLNSAGLYGDASTAPVATISGNFSGGYACTSTPAGLQTVLTMVTLKVAADTAPLPRYMHLSSLSTISKSAAETETLSLSARIVEPNRCRGYDPSNPPPAPVVGPVVPVPNTPSPHQHFNMSWAKKAHKIKTEEDFENMRDGGHYKLDLDVDLVLPDDFPPLRPLRNVFFEGNAKNFGVDHDTGKKIKVKRMDQEGRNNVGVFSALDCSVIDDTTIIIGDEPDDPGIKGKKCVGGIVGIIRRTLVSNARVERDPDITAAVDAIINGREDVGVLAGCMDNPGFWHSRVTSAYTDAYVGIYGENTSDSSDVERKNIGAAVGLNKGLIEKVHTKGKITGPDFAGITTTSVGGIAGKNGGKTGDSKSIAGIIRESKSETLIEDKGADRPMHEVGGLVGTMVAGEISASQFDKGEDDTDVDDTNDKFLDVSGNMVGGLVGKMAAEETNDVFGLATMLKISESTSAARIGRANIGNKRGGVVGVADGSGTTSGVEISYSYANELPTNNTVFGLADVGGFIGEAKGKVDILESYTNVEADGFDGTDGLNKTHKGFFGKVDGAAVVNVTESFYNVAPYSTIPLDSPTGYTNADQVLTDAAATDYANDFFDKVNHYKSGSPLTLQDPVQPDPNPNPTIETPAGGPYP